MKLFSLPDGTVDRKDRAQWMTPPFDLAFAAPETDKQLRIAAQDTFQGGAKASSWYQGGAEVNQ